MNTEIIQKLLRNTSSNAYQNNAEIQLVRDKFLVELKNDFHNISNAEDKNINDEKQLIDTIYNNVSNTNFTIILECHEYYDEFEKTINDCNLYIGMSKNQLIKIKKKLDKIQASYENEFEKFCKNINDCLNRNSKSLDLETKEEIKLLCEKKLISKSLFNKLKNEKLL